MKVGEVMKEIILESLELKHRVYINNNLNRFHNILLENKIKDTDSIFIVTDKIYIAYINIRWNNL